MAIVYIDEWITGPAGSVSATNGTGTIGVSGEQVIRLPIDRIKKLLFSMNVSNLVSIPNALTRITNISQAIPL